MIKNTELEYRAEIPVEDLSDVLKEFEKTCEHISVTNRLSFMSFFEKEDNIYDLRARITNGEAEVVLKIGKLHANDRTEMSQNITKDQLLGFSRMFSHLSKNNYIAERKTYNFKSPEGITASIVDAGSVAYIEFELLCRDDEIEKNDIVLKNYITSKKIHVLDEEGFKSLNKKLDSCDWKFIDNDECVNKLSSIISNY